MRAARFIVVGLVLGALPAVFIRAAIKLDRPPGVTLVPVAVAARALPTGAVLQLDDVTLRSLPEALVTPSVVTPGSITYVVNQPLKVPLAAGEPLRWLAIATPAMVEGGLAAPALVEGCSAEMAKRNVAAAPPTVSELRKAVLEGAP